MADYKDIRNQRLTLEIDGPQITAEKFELGVRSFLAIIKNVATTFLGHPKGVRWLVDVESGSVKLNFTPQPVKAPVNAIPSTLDTIENGFVLLESGSTRPPHFSDKALKQAHILASISDVEGTEIDRVRVWRNGKPNPISTKTLVHVDSIIATDSRDWGTIEGRLSVLSERGGLRFTVYDPVTNKAIRCHFDETLLDDAINAFRQRVSVCGLIRYRSDGQPISIKVDKFFVLPRPETLPRIEDVRGILGKPD